MAIMSEKSRFWAPELPIDDDRWPYLNYVYKITCTKNGKAYIGKAANPKWRIHSHYKRLEHGRHSSKELQEDYDNYGYDSFSFEILGVDNVEGVNLEIEMQGKFKTFLPEFGYNTKDQHWYRKGVMRDTCMKYV